MASLALGSLGLAVQNTGTALAAPPDLHLTAGTYVFNTETGAVTAGGSSIVVPSSLNTFDADDLRQVRQFEVGTLQVDVGADVSFTGSRVAALRATGPVTVDGSLNASGLGGAFGDLAATSPRPGGGGGPGGTAGGSGGGPNQAGGNAAGLSGGGGGTNLGCGGLGGAATVNGTAGFNGANSLRCSGGSTGNGAGGGGGGDRAGGGGGGGSLGCTTACGAGGGGNGGRLVLASSASITVGGRVVACGGPGGDLAGNGGNGGGGGGGTLVLDAPSVTVTASGVLGALGGPPGGIRGGGACAATTNTPGQGGAGAIHAYTSTLTQDGVSSPAPLTHAYAHTPHVTADSYGTSAGTTLTVAAPGVLTNDSSPDPEALTATAVTGPASGTLTLAGDGSFSYSPNSGFSGTDGFTYRAEDAWGNGAQAAVTITVTAGPPPSGGTAVIQPPINADESAAGRSTFKASRGVIPVKFGLLVDGAATCDLPPATVTLAKLGTAGPEPVNESLYTSPADSGDNFRISSCRYIYNLAASSLGAGSYRVAILINGTEAGHAIFDLR